MSEEKVQFEHIAREWRMKYSENGLKGGAVEQDKLFKSKYLAQVKALEGFKSVDRVVCGGCNDFKLVVKLNKPGWEKWGQSYHYVLIS